jgi:hypothetical protein
VTANSLRHVPVIGGLATWHIPLVATILGLGALGHGLLELAVAVGVFGFVAQTLLRSVVLEISPRGLTRGLALNGRFLGPTTVMAWEAIASLHTDWRRPGDDTALATTVRDSHGHAIRFTTAMGLRGYWACLAAVGARVPAARRSGLTDALLSNEPPGRRTLLSAAATAGVLALLIVMLVGMHYLFAQGPSTLTRYLEQTGGTGPQDARHSPSPDRQTAVR